MKNDTHIRKSFMMILILGISISMFAMGEKDDIIDTINYKVYYGHVVDSNNGRVLPFATVEVLGSGMATVTNIDGNFTIKIPKDDPGKELKITYIGYKNELVSLDQFRGTRTKNIGMQATTVMIQEITIRPQDALGLISEMLTNIKNNYSVEPMMMRGFYRETIQRGRNYVSISEAVVDIYKSEYSNNFRVDQVKLYKGRKSADVEKMDTVLFKVQGGPSTAILLDIVKNPYILLSANYQDIYNFTLEDMISIDDQLHYVVGFRQQKHVDDPYYMGKFYIDMEKLAISEAEFELNTENAEEAARLFIQRKPMGMSIQPEKAVYRAKYTIEDDRWYFSYARAEVKFKVNWKKKFFNTNFSTMSEIAITDRTYQGIEKFANKDRFKTHDVMGDKVYIFFDQDFWAGYNVIEPDQSIESAIRKLNKKYLRRN